MTTEMVNVTIDGMSLQVAKGTMVIEAAKQAGVLVPHVQSADDAAAVVKAARVRPGAAPRPALV